MCRRAILASREDAILGSLPEQIPRNSGEISLYQHSARLAAAKKEGYGVIRACLTLSMSSTSRGNYPFSPSRVPLNFATARLYRAAARRETFPVVSRVKSHSRNRTILPFLFSRSRYAKRESRVVQNALCVKSSRRRRRSRRRWSGRRGRMRL